MAGADLVYPGRALPRAGRRLDHEVATVSYALERFDPETRKALLAATRG